MDSLIPKIPVDWLPTHSLSQCQALPACIGLQPEGARCEVTPFCFSALLFSRLWCSDIALLISHYSYFITYISSLISHYSYHISYLFTFNRPRSLYHGNIIMSLWSYLIWSSNRTQLFLQIYLDLFIVVLIMSFWSMISMNENKNICILSRQQTPEFQIKRFFFFLLTDNSNQSISQLINKYFVCLLYL